MSLLEFSCYSRKYETSFIVLYILITITTEWICMNVSRMIKLSFKLLKLSFFYHSRVCLYVCAQREAIQCKCFISIFDWMIMIWRGLTVWAHDFNTYTCSYMHTYIHIKLNINIKQQFFLLNLIICLYVLTMQF